MPFIHIKSLPFEKPIVVNDVLQGLNRDFSEVTGIPLFHVHSTWEFLTAGHYVKGEQAPVYQPFAHHPLLIDLLTPDFNDEKKIGVMLECVALSLAERTGFNQSNIFINHRQAHSLMVYDDGEIVSW